MAQIKTDATYVLTLNMEEAAALVSALMPYDTDLTNPIFCLLDEAGVRPSHTAIRIADGTNVWADTLGLRDK